MYCFFFFFNDTATTEIYTLPLHDALPILSRLQRGLRRVVGCVADPARSLGRGDPSGAAAGRVAARAGGGGTAGADAADRKSTRLNSSHGYISYAVFCLKKKNS